MIDKENFVLVLLLGKSKKQNLVLYMRLNYLTVN
jgi:hypothetical protein